jgi:hypothetical protein
VSAVSAGKEPLPGSKRLVTTAGMIPRIVRRTVALPCWLAAGAMPLITLFSRSRSNSRERWFFW